MYQVIVLTGPDTFERAHWPEAEALIDLAGTCYSLRAGPRQPLPSDHAWDPVVVYAPDEISEEEFQEWYARQQPQVEELRLKY